MLASTEKQINTQKGRVMGYDTIQVPKTRSMDGKEKLLSGLRSTKKDVNAAEGVRLVYGV
jgi:hypothetical protein